jgi:hypothetical protein
MRWDVVRVDRLAIHLLAEAEQQLRQITCRVQPVRPRSGRVEDWRQCSGGLAYLFLSVSSESASLAKP